MLAAFLMTFHRRDCAEGVRMTNQPLPPHRPPSLWKHRPLSLGFSIVVASAILVSFDAVIYNINQISARQTLTPKHLLSRMTASIRFMIWGILPIGSLIGGLLGSRLGLRTTLIIAAGGMLPLLAAWILPIRTLRSVDAP